MTHSGAHLGHGASALRSFPQPLQRAIGLDITRASHTISSAPPTRPANVPSFTIQNIGSPHSAASGLRLPTQALSSSGAAVSYCQRSTQTVRHAATHSGVRGRERGLAVLQDAVSVEVLEQIRRRFEEQPHLRKLFLDRVRERLCWTGSYAQASRRLSLWLSGDDVHRFPLDVIEDLIRTFGDAAFLDPFLAVEQRVQRAARGERIGPMRSVRPQHERRRESA